MFSDAIGHKPASGGSPTDRPPSPIFTGVDMEMTITEHMNQVVHLCPKCVKCRVEIEGKRCQVCEAIAKNRSGLQRDIRNAKLLAAALVIVAFSVLGMLIYMVSNLKPRSEGVGAPESSGQLAGSKVGIVKDR